MSQPDHPRRFQSLAGLHMEQVASVCEHRNYEVAGVIACGQPDQSSNNLALGSFGREA